MDEPSMIPFSNDEYFTPKGCNPCRKSKVKCKEQRPSCVRCLRLPEPCSWPSRQLRLEFARRGPGSYRSRAGNRRLNDIRSNDTITSSSQAVQTTANATPSLIAVNPVAMMDNFFQADYDETWENEIYLEDPMNIQFQESLDGTQPISFEISGNFPMFTPLAADHNGYFDIGSFIFDSLPIHPVQSASSVIIGSNERSALGHYQSTFSIYRTTKRPIWSTHTLLLDKGNNNQMIMHFILAVSINDLSHRREGSPPQEAQGHFELAERDLNEIILNDSAADHITLMISFLLLYLYIPKRKSFPRERIQQLSIDVYEYISRHELDSRCLKRTPGPVVGDNFSDADRALLARLIIWIYDEDVKCSFQGFGGYLAEHLTAHRERTMAVCEVSRTALGAHWGAAYPEEEAADDDENAVELEFLWALTTLWQDINQLSQGAGDFMLSKRQVDQRFRLLERKYSTVFQNSAQTTMPRTRTLVNSDYDVVLFNALKVYNFRSTIVDLEMEIPEDIQHALTDILELMWRTFASNKNELHDRLQWPLFLAGMEIKDKIHRYGIVCRLSKRPKAVLAKIVEYQDAFTPRRRMEMDEVRSLLYKSNWNEGNEGNEGNEHSLPLLQRGYVMDDDVGF